MNNSTIVLFLWVRPDPEIIGASGQTQLYFFKPVNEFVKEGKANNARQVKDQCKHLDLYFSETILLVL